jgi:hypothetical protein
MVSVAVGKSISNYSSSHEDSPGASGIMILADRAQLSEVTDGAGHGGGSPLERLA